MESSFKGGELYSKIQHESERHKSQQLNFRFKGPEMLKLLDALPKTPELEKLVESVFNEALQKSDKRPMSEQLTLKQKYQKSHGLVLKDIPIHVERHVIFDAILKLGRTVNASSGQFVFPGACKLRSFFFPAAKHKQQTHRVCFPIFVNKRDQMYIYQWAQNQSGKILLDVPRQANWNGLVSVELTRQDAYVPAKDDATALTKGFTGLSLQTTPAAAPYTYAYTTAPPPPPSTVSPTLQYPYYATTTQGYTVLAQASYPNSSDSTSPVQDKATPTQ